MLRSEIMGCIQRTLPAVMEDVLSRLRPGELYEFYGPKATSMSKAERDRRITEALQAGQPLSEIGKREHITPRHVRRIRARIGTGGTGG
jgi:Mor family transcriptional regulator